MTLRSGAGQTPGDIVSAFAKGLNVASPVGATDAERVSNLIESIHAEVLSNPEFHTQEHADLLGELSKFTNSLGDVQQAAESMLNKSIQTIKANMPLQVQPQLYDVAIPVQAGKQIGPQEIGPTEMAPPPFAPQTEKIVAFIQQPAQIQEGQIQESIPSQTSQMLTPQRVSTPSQMTPQVAPQEQTQPILSAQATQKILSDEITTKSASLLPNVETKQVVVPLTKLEQVFVEEHGFFPMPLVPQAVPEAIVQRLSVAQNIGMAHFIEVLQNPTMKVQVHDSIRQLVSYLLFNDNIEQKGALAPRDSLTALFTAKERVLENLLQAVHTVNDKFPAVLAQISLAELFLLNLATLQGLNPVLYSTLLQDEGTKTTMLQACKQHASRLQILERRFLQKPLSAVEVKEHAQKREELTKLIAILKEIKPSFDPLSIPHVKELLPSDAVSLIQQVHCGLSLQAVHTQKLFENSKVSNEQFVLYYLKEGGLVQERKGEPKTVISRHSIEAVLQELRDPARRLRCLTRNDVKQLFPAWNISAF